jgi:threonine/homoserine/homoserine lactone efflux protein
VNPKVWAVALAASAGYSIDLNIWAEAARLFLGFSMINLFVCLFWTSAGHLLAGYLQNPVIWRTFMTIMATLMASSAALIFI